MPTALDKRDQMVQYLKAEQLEIQNEIAAHELLSDTELEEKGLLLRNLKYIGKETFQFATNNSKLRVGDRVLLLDDTGKNITELHDFEVCEMTIDTITLQSTSCIPSAHGYQIRVHESDHLDHIIKLLDNMVPGGAGGYYLEQLGGLDVPSSMGMVPTSIAANYSPNLDIQQNSILAKTLALPSIMSIQGPPGTGKTRLLAAVACTYAEYGMDVLVVANSNDAVNNALNKCVDMGAPKITVAKMGNKLKTVGLDPRVVMFDTVPSTPSFKKKKRLGYIVGATLHLAAIKVGLSKKNFHPVAVLVDEAGQMTLPMASIIGTFGAGSVLFFGDEKQMPPIFTNALKADPLSVSVFEHLCHIHPTCKEGLVTTYRMNDDITDFVSREFYEPAIKLISSPSSAHRHLCCPILIANPKISCILNTTFSLHCVSVSTRGQWQDYNREECLFAAELIGTAASLGMPVDQMAVITPFRRQVAYMRAIIKDETKLAEIPIVDTVERLQGQEVEMIIISLCVTDPNYYKDVKEFILNRNRLNVMVSRAKTKVVFLGERFILRNMWGDEYESKFNPPPLMSNKNVDGFWPSISKEENIEEDNELNRQ